MAKRTYIIVHMKHHDRPSVYPSSTSDALLSAYTSAFNGFVAALDASEADALRGSDSVLGVYQVHTTRTPEFDTGVCPESKSFDDTGMPENPTQWRGDYESGPDFNKALCNRKLIGARSFSIGFHNEGEKPIAASVETAREEKIKAQADAPVDEEGNVSNTSSNSEGIHEENEGQAGSKKGWLWCMVVPALSLLSIASLYLIIRKFRVANVDITLSEDSGEENEGWLLGMVAQACRLLGAATVHLLKATKIVINYGDFKFEIPLRAL